MKNSYTLLTPGPVLLTGPVREILSEQSLHHRGEYFKSLLKDVKQSLQNFFQTQQSVMILTSTGTGAMEAAITNTLSPKDTVLCVCSGKFGNRWKEISSSYGLKVKTLDIPWGQAVLSKSIQQALEQDSNIKALFVSACETSTGTNQPIHDIGKILQKHPQTLFVVDGITGLGAMDLPMDLWGIDILVGGSQKGFGLPTGLSFISLSQKAWEFQKQAQCPRYYFDLKREKEQEDKGQTSFSINVTLIKALQTSLNQILNNSSLEQNILRCRTLAHATHTFCKLLNLNLFSKRPSYSVTAIEMPPNISAQKIKKEMETNHQVIVAGGQEHLKDKIIRIGHLGYIQNKDLVTGLKALAHSLHKEQPQAFPQERINQALQKTEELLK